MSQTAPTTAAVRAQLASILESTAFRDSERHRKLLTFLVESTLRGEADGLKEFVIAAEVWGRDTSFDPRIHSTVRVEIGRLRARLDRYYAAAGAQDPIRLRIPTGGYVVIFESSGEPVPTEEVDRFEILESIGSGGMAEVWKARDRRLDRLVALKFIKPEHAHDPAAIERFEVEARSAAAINHPNICTVYDVGSLNGRSFLAIELLDGETLKRLLEKESPSLDSVLTWAIQIADGLDAAHSAGVIHRDLKPANLFVTSRGQAKILDFGLARLRYADTDPEHVAGTIGYMSPEQLRAEILDTRSDLFAFGVVLFEMVTGRQAFGGSASDSHRSTLTADLGPPSQWNRQVPPELDRIVGKAIEKDRDLRYQHASEIRADLKRLKRDTDSGHSVPAPPIAKPQRVRPWMIGAAVVGAAAICAGFFLYPRLQKKPALDHVVLSDFVNTTGDPVFSDTLRQALSAQLEQSPFLTLLSDRRIAQTLKLMERGKDSALPPEIAREVCRRTGSTATIEGSITALGGQYVLGLRAVSCSTGDLLAQDQSTASGKEQVLKALGESATRLRRNLGESLASVEKHDVPLANVTTNSLEALEAYSRGMQETAKGDLARAIPFYERAIQLDPKFAMAYARLSRAYGVLGGAEREDQVIPKAYELRDRVSDPERFYIVAHYQQYLTGDLDAARKTLELWQQTYPRDPDPPANLVRLYITLGDFDKALAAARTESQLNPVANVSVATTLVYLNRLDEAEAALRDLQSRNYDSAQVNFYLYEISFLRHDAAAMEKYASAVRSKAGWESLMLDLESFSAAFAGQIAQSRDLTRRAIGFDKQHHQNDDAASHELESAIREGLLGEAEVAKRQAHEGLALSDTKDNRVFASLAMALAGDREGLRIDEDLMKKYPEDTQVQINDAEVRAAVAYRSGAPEDIKSAAEAMSKIAPFELAGAAVVVPVYTRGLALLAAHDGAGAVTAFQRTVDHPGITRNFVTGSLAYLELGRAYAMKGDPAKAREAYGKFLEIWKNADPEAPLLKAARTELGALK